MTHAIWVAAALLFAVFGFATRSLDLEARLAVRFATGIVIGGTLMWVESLLWIRWSRPALWIPMVLCAGAAVVLARRKPHAEPPVEDRRGRLSSTLALWLIALIAAYAAFTARETNADVLYFWGPKGQAFFLSRAVDSGFLRYPFFFLMHPDYPPLLPIVYAWCSVAAHHFSYFGAVLLTPIYIVASACAFRGYATTSIANRSANAFAILLAALFAFGAAAATIAGGADAQLLMFEIVALAALTFSRDATLVAAVALGGAAFTKVEGAAFAIVVIVAHAIIRRDVRRTIVLAVPSIALLWSWLVFAKHAQIIDAYALGGHTVYWSQLSAVVPRVVRQGAYKVLWVPWIAAAAPLAVARKWRPALLPLAVALGSLGYSIFFYLHAPDASWWIDASARRVLLTPLLSLSVAAAATSE